MKGLSLAANYNQFRRPGKQRWAWLRKNVHQKKNTLVSIPHVTACSTSAAEDCRRAIRKLMQHSKNSVRSADRLLSQMQMQLIDIVCCWECFFGRESC